MAFNAQAAITYNEASKYPGNAIKVILDAVRAPFGFSWSVPGVTAVMQYQQKNGLDADGMVGLKSLDKIVSDLTTCGKFSDVSVIKTFIAEALANRAAKKRTVGEIVSSFQPNTTIYPFRFEKHTAPHPTTNQIVPSWMVSSTFQVSVKFNPNLSETDRSRYEYRQYIRGSATVQDGSRNANGIWMPTLPVRITNVGKTFAVPFDPNSPGIGLTTHYKEDGKTATDAGSKCFRFGYRGGAEINGNRFRNVWSPDPETGTELTLRDTPGYGEPYIAGLAPKVKLNFTFRGVVVEVEQSYDAEGVVFTKVIKEITDRTWNLSYTGELDWANIQPLIQD